MRIKKALPTLGPTIRRTAFVLLTLAVLRTDAMAGGSTIAVGARTRSFQPALVGEFWVGRVGFSAEAGIGLSETENTYRSADGSTAGGTDKDRGSSVQAGAALYYVLARGKRSQLSAGLRFGYGRAHSWNGGQEDKIVESYTELTIPVRAEVWVVDRVSLYVELGMGVRDTKRDVKSPPFRDSESNMRELITIGDPLGNAGVSFHF